MYWQFLKAVFRKTAEPMGGLAELAVTIAALAAPAIGKFAGVTMPSDSIFAYLGMALVALAILRIFFVAPYHLWKDQLAQIGGLKLELSEPERKEIAHMASIRAEKRLELAAQLREFHWLSFTILEGETKTALNEPYGKALRLMGQAGVPESFGRAFGMFTDACVRMNRSRRAGDAVIPAKAKASNDILESMVEFLHGRINAEALALKLAEFPPDEPELPLPPVPAKPEEPEEPKAAQ